MYQSLKKCLVLICSWAFFSTPVFAQDILRLSTTTSTENSGLLKFLLPAFEADSKIKVQVIAVGSGKALELAKNGDVDVALVHAREAEDQFVAAGFGVYRHDVMFNDFVLVGPDNDPAGVRQVKDVVSGFKRIFEQKATFISRGDRSGTDMMEQSYWKNLGQKPIAPAYVSAGLGMGEVLNMAAEMQAYTLSDRATFAAYKNGRNGRIKSSLQIVLEGDARMRNPYGVIAVNPARYPDIKFASAKKFIDWLCSDAGQKKIAAFKVDGAQVFFPNSAH
ncbi:MAG: substrate-binding domain-containing protein [Burkholderiales bacterium]|nr:substrate-binding domain-containing protein [Burkholderiales bacterium]